jgi:hypothetical protein
MLTTATFLARETRAAHRLSSDVSRLKRLGARRAGRLGKGYQVGKVPATPTSNRQPYHLRSTHIAFFQRWRRKWRKNVIFPARPRSEDGGAERARKRLPARAEALARACRALLKVRLL